MRIFATILLSVFLTPLIIGCNNKAGEQKSTITDTAITLVAGDTSKPGGNIPGSAQPGMESPTQQYFDLAKAKELLGLKEGPCELQAPRKEDEVYQYVVPLAYDKAGAGQGIIKIHENDRWFLHKAWDPGKKEACFVLAVAYGDNTVAPQFFKGSLMGGTISGLSAGLTMLPCLKEHLIKNHLVEINKSGAGLLIANQQSGRIYTLEVPPGSTAFYNISRKAVSYCIFVRKPANAGSGKTIKGYLLWPLDKDGSNPDKYYYQLGGYSCMSTGGDYCPLMNP